MKSNTDSHSTQYFLEQARDAIRLARRKAENEPPSVETLEEIHRLCATSDFNLTRALNNCKQEMEAKEAATSLLPSSTLNRTAIEREQH